MEFYINQILDGMATGSVYGILGLSLMFIYRATKVVNFAQGEMATLSTFLMHSFMKIFPTTLAFILAVLVTFGYAVIFEVIILKRIKNDSVLGKVIVTVGFYAIINSSMNFIYGHEPYTFPSPFDDKKFEFFSFVISGQSVFVFISTLFLSFMLYLLFKFSRLGIAFKGISEDQLATRLKGVRVGAMLSISWGLSACVGAFAGFLIAPSIFLYSNMMSNVLLYAFTAAVLGGLDSAFGAIVGGIIVGIVENLAGTQKFIGSDLKGVAVYLMLVLVLIIRPRGIFGKKEARKV